jgi:hypothetical protein
LEDRQRRKSLTPPQAAPWACYATALGSDVRLLTGRGEFGSLAVSKVLTTMDKKPRIFTTSFASVYPLYVPKVEKKGRTQQEVDEVITWLTGYAGEELKRVIDTKVDFETFFAEAPRMNAKVGLIKGVVCGVRVEEVADPLMRNIRYLDKLVDELAKGKKMESILRS